MDQFQTERILILIEVSMLFVIVAGKLVDNKITWRGDSALKDGSEEDLDLSKGMYDAGDHVKFGFPLAYTATMLSWAILEYGDQMDTVKQLEPAKDSLKWITDYLINAHPSANVLYVQVTLAFNLSSSIVQHCVSLCACAVVSIHFFASILLPMFEDFMIILKNKLARNSTIISQI